MKGDANVRDESQLEIEYREVKLITPTKGNHKFTQRQKLYEEVHNFLSTRKWAPVKADTDVGGIAWIELFVLFDTTGYRSEEGQHIKNKAVTKRAEGRKGNKKNAKGKRGSPKEATAESKPTLDEELKVFKAMVRHITKYEAEPQASKWFQADSRSRLRRLGNLGVNGRQPAIAV